MISSSTRSVTAASRSNFSLTPAESGRKVTPEVSRQVWIPRFLASSNSSVTKPICVSGSPPLTVMPPFR